MFLEFLLFPGKTDADGDGTITKNELRRFLKTLGNELTEDDVDVIYKTVDRNGDGHIDFSEFLHLMEVTSSGKVNSRDELREAFSQFDDDGNGQITRAELKSTMSKLGRRLALTDEQVEQIMSQVDVDGDGQINFEEFEKLMTSR